MIRYNDKHSRHDTNPFVVGKLAAAVWPSHEGLRPGRTALEIRMQGKASAENPSTHARAGVKQPLTAL